MQACEGDYIEDFNGLIFDVKGLVHPPRRVIAFPRFIPDKEGDRLRRGIAYRKVYGLSERYEFLKKNFPQYLVYNPVFDEHLCEIPIENIKHHYKPANCLKSLRKKPVLDCVETEALEFATLLKENANISWSKLGVSGSLLVRLHATASDIDLVVYGSKNCREVHEALQTLFDEEEGFVRAYTVKDLEKLFDFRSKDTQISFEAFVRTESRKVLQGKFKRRDYFIRFVKDWNEIGETYGSTLYKNVGYAKITATIVDDSDSLFTPCTYKVESVKFLEGPIFTPMKEISSFRGRFCEQARNGETVVAQGKVERVQKTGQEAYYRLLLGSNPTDYMILT
ncbi:MAG: hypothetical protein QW821_01515 [Candidatus Bathyarchaeia archaeon]